MWMAAVGLVFHTPPSGHSAGPGAKISWIKSTWEQFYHLLQIDQPIEKVVFPALMKPATTTNKMNTHGNPICKITLPIQEHGC